MIMSFFIHEPNEYSSPTEQVNKKKCWVKELQIKHWTTSIRNSRNLQLFYRVVLVLMRILKLRYLLDTVQDFLIKLGITPGMHLVEIGILSLNNVIVRPTKIINRADKNWTHF